MESLLQIYWYFFSHSIKIYVGLPLSAVSLSRCITCPDVCVQQSHAGLPFSDYKQSRLHTKTKPYSCNKNPESVCYEQKYMSVLIWIEKIIEYRFSYSSSSSSAAKNFVPERAVIDVVSHWRLCNNWKVIQNTSKNLSKFVSGSHSLFGLILAAPLSSSKFSSAEQILPFERPFCCSRRLHNVGKILCW